MIRGTIEYNSNQEKVFLPQLSCDFFIGVLKPNQYTIDKDSYKIESDIECTENDIVYADLNYSEKTCRLVEPEREVD